MTKVTEKDLTFGNADQTKFMRKVYKSQVKSRERNGKTYYAGVLDGDLVRVEGDFFMRTKAAAALKKLLKQARDDLDTEQKAKNKLALKVKEVGISSTYRAPKKEKVAYINAFSTHYNGFLSTKYPDLKDRHGDVGLQAMIGQMNKKKAPVGFSNHTSGIAVDFKTRQNGLGTLGPKSIDSAKWKKSWLFKWLGKNDTGLDFKKLRTEEWHWDYVK